MPADGESPLDMEKQDARDIEKQEDAVPWTSDEDQQLETVPEPDPDPDFLDTDASGAAGVLNRVLSRISTTASKTPGPPPDGGKKAWLMCKQAASIPPTI